MPITGSAKMRNRHPLPCGTEMKRTPSFLGNLPLTSLAWLALTALGSAVAARLGVGGVKELFYTFMPYAAGCGVFHAFMMQFPSADKVTKARRRSS
jgi:hypothetical protein